MDKTLEILSKSLAQIPTDWEVRSHLIDLYVERGAVVMAVNLARDAPNLPQEDASLIDTVRFIARQDPFAALEFAERAIAEEPMRGASHFSKSLACQAVGQPDAANRHREDALRLDPSLAAQLDAEPTAPEPTAPSEPEPQRQKAPASFKATHIQVSKRKTEAVPRAQIKKAQHRRQLIVRSCLIVAAVCLGLFAVYQIFIQRYPQYDPFPETTHSARKPAQQARQNIEFKKISPVVAYGQNTALLDLIMSNAGYLARASSWREMLPFVRSAATVRPRMEAYYRNRPFSPITVNRAAASILIIPRGKHPFAVVSGIMTTNAAGDKTTKRDCVFDLLSNPPRLDWEALVGWNPVTLRELSNSSRLSDEEQITGAFLKELRVVVSTSTRELSDAASSGLPFFDLTHPDEPGVTLVGIPANQNISSALLTDALEQSLLQPAILLLAPTGTTTPDGAPIVRILNVEQLGWVRADP